MPSLTDRFVLNSLPNLDGDEVKLALAFTVLPPKGAELSRTDLCSRAGIATNRLDKVLDHMVYSGIIVRGSVTKGVEKITVSHHIDGQEKQVKLLPWADTEQTIFSLQKDKQQLTAKLRRVEDSSDLPEKLSLEEGNVARLVEQVLGRAMTLEEAYKLGTMIQGYGPDRVKGAVLSRKKTTNPLYSAGAMLFNGARGPSAPKKDSPRPITYFAPNDDFHPYS